MDSRQLSLLSELRSDEVIRKNVYFEKLLNQRHEVCTEYSFGVDSGMPHDFRMSFRSKRCHTASCLWLITYNIDDFINHIGKLNSEESQAYVVVYTTTTDWFFVKLQYLGTML